MILTIATIIFSNYGKWETGQMSNHSEKNLFKQRLKLFLEGYVSVIFSKTEGHVSCNCPQTNSKKEMI